MVTLSRPRVNDDAIGLLVMLKNTFCHIPGISPAAEQRLWSVGIDCWDAALKANRLALPSAPLPHFHSTCTNRWRISKVAIRSTSPSHCKRISTGACFLNFATPLRISTSKRPVWGTATPSQQSCCTMVSGFVTTCRATISMTSCTTSASTAQSLPTMASHSTCRLASASFASRCTTCILI